MAKVLVTGATGFIGGYIVKELLRQNHQVIASSSNQNKAEQEEWYINVIYIPFNIKEDCSELDLYSFFEKPDVMIHLAWEGLPNYKSDFHILENLPRHKNFLRNLVQNGLKSLCVTGTCFEYGMLEGCVSEESQTVPTNAYAIAKDELRKFLEELSLEIQFNFSWARLFYMYGDGQNAKSLIPQLHDAIINHEQVFNMSGGEQIRDFLPVSRVAEYIIDIALSNRSVGVVNCCSGRPVKVIDFVKEYIDSMGAEIKLNLGYYPYPDYEPMAFWGDNSKLLKMIQKPPIK